MRSPEEQPRRPRVTQDDAGDRRGPDRRGRAAAAPTTGAARDVVFDVERLSVTYSGNARARGRHARHPQELRDGVHRAVGLRQVDVHPLLQPDERPDPRRQGRRADPLPRPRPLRRRSVDPVEVRRRIGMVFQKPNPFPKSIYDNIAFGPRVLGMKKGLDERVERALAPGGALGRGQGPAQGQRARPLGRPAAAALHRPRDRGRARRDPDGRAGLGARPDLDERASRT